MVEVSESRVRIGQSSLDELRQLMHDKPGTLYAILDACDEPRVPARVRELGPEHAVSLYRGWAEQQYWALAPYLVQVDDQVLEWIIANLWKDPWGIFVVAEMPLADLRRHLRRFLKVQDPDGDELYFRYYDPRVLPTFLKTCDESQTEEFFGPVQRFCVADGETGLSTIERVNRRSAIAHPASYRPRGDDHER